MANTSIKHLQIDKSQTQVLALIAVTVAVVIFSLFGLKAMISKGLYQRRALHAERDAVTQLRTNITNANTLIAAYKTFAEQNPNLLGGDSNGKGDKDGSNPTIVLDSLPNKYDGPALGSSVEKILTLQNLTINSLSVPDDPLANPDKPDPNPQPKQLTFNYSGSSNYKGVTQLLQAFEASIRPFDITTVSLSGTDDNLTLNVGVSTFFQPSKSLDLTKTKDVK